MSQEVQILRDVSSAASLLAKHGSALPAPVEEARALHRDLRRQPPVLPDDDEIGALYLDEGPAKAVKALTAARATQDAYSAARLVAAKRALYALRDHADEVTSAILQSPGLVAAVDEIRAVVEDGVNPALARHPQSAPGGPDAAEVDVIHAARLRRAEGVIVSAATAMSTIHSLGFWTEEDRRGLLWLDASGVEDFTLLGRALRAIRHGHEFLPANVTRPGVAGPVMEDSWLGIISAAASAVPGVEYRLVSSYDEYVDRVRVFESGLARTRKAAEPSRPSTTLVFG